MNQKEDKQYQAQDTDPQQDYDQTPEYMIDREIIGDTLEQQYLTKLPFGKHILERGQSRGNKGLFSFGQENTVMDAGIFKSVIKLKESFTQKAAEVAQKLLQYITPRTVKVRLYVLRAKSLTPMDLDGKSDPYLVIKVGDRQIQDEKSQRKSTNNPNFYTFYQLPVKLPGDSILEIQVWDQDGIDDDLIGVTKIDLQDRYFSKRFQSLPFKKPIEERPLFSNKSKAPQGVLQCFVEILNNAEAKKMKPWDITPPERKQFELRVIIWETKGVKAMDAAQGCNDLYVKGRIGGTNQDQETDTHWRCRKRGVFNYRWKFPMILPLDPDQDYGKDKLKISLWDRDVFTSNQMICECQIDLKDHNVLQKVYKRNDAVKMKRVQKGKAVDKFWVQLTHPTQQLNEEGRRKSLGQVQISVQVLPKQLAQQRLNGLGRQAPNAYPTLPQPTGRFSFVIFLDKLFKNAQDILSPWKTFKQIVGPDIACKCCCICWSIICCIVLGYLGYFVIGNLISDKIING